MFRTRLHATSAALLVTAALPHASASAAVINVPADLPLTVAIAVAQDGDEIVISPDGSPYLVFPGIIITDKALTLRGSTGSPGDVTIDGAGLDVTLTIIGSGSSGFVLQDLTITGGLSDDVTDALGGGMSVQGVGSMEIRNCIFEENQMRGSGSNGAGFYSNGTDLLVADTIVRNNTSNNVRSDGIGVYANGGNIVIQDSVFEGNRAIDANGDPIPQNNGGEGGGIYADGGGSISMIRTTFRNNTAGEGGAFWIGSGRTVLVEACLFEDNTSDVAGGAAIVASNAVSAVLRNSVFVGNVSNSLRGAAAIVDAPTDIENCTFVANTGPDDIISTINSNGASVTIDNSIVWGNNAPGIIEQTAPISVASSPLVRNSIVQGGYNVVSRASNNLDLDPLFADQAGRDFSLTALSPAIDSGDSTAYSGPFIDFAGNDRASDTADTADTGITVNGPVIDRGAFEFPAASTVDACPVDTNADDSIDTADLLNILANFNTPCP